MRQYYVYITASSGRTLYVGVTRAAIEREKELKGWRRSKKVALVESVNPEWKDLALRWYG